MFEFWLRLIAYISVPLSVMFIPFYLLSPENALAIFPFMPMLAMTGSYYAITRHHKWYMNKAQLEYEREQDIKMLNEYSADELAEEVLAGRFPFRCKKPWS
jgi:hypothetical protein